MTLIELLAVIAVITLLISAGASILRGPRTEISAQGAVDAVAAIVEQASTVAKSRRSPTRLVINTEPTSANFARQIAVYSKDGSGQWTLRAGPHLLPRQIYFDEDYSDGFIPAKYKLNIRAAQSGSEGDTVVAYEFDRNGHFITPGGVPLPRLVVVPGLVGESSPRELVIGAHQVNSRGGFLFRRNGYVTRFESFDQIPEPSTP